MTKNDETGGGGDDSARLKERADRLRKQEATILFSMKNDARLLAETIDQQNDWPPVVWASLISKRLDALLAHRAELLKLGT